jgi:hypothetical protein
MARLPNFGFSVAASITINYYYYYCAKNSSGPSCLPARPPACLPASSLRLRLPRLPKSDASFLFCASFLRFFSTTCCPVDTVTVTAVTTSTFYGGPSCALSLTAQTPFFSVLNLTFPTYLPTDLPPPLPGSFPTENLQPSPNLPIHSKSPSRVSELASSSVHQRPQSIEYIEANGLYLSIHCDC